MTGESLLIPRRASYEVKWFDVALKVCLSQPEVKSQALTPTTMKGHDYLFVVADRFRKMCVLMSCKNIINGKEVVIVFIG